MQNKKDHQYQKQILVLILISPTFTKIDYLNDIGLYQTVQLLHLMSILISRILQVNFKPFMRKSQSRKISR